MVARRGASELQAGDAGGHDAHPRLDPSRRPRGRCRIDLIPSVPFDPLDIAGHQHAPPHHDQKAILGRLSPEQVTATELAGEPIVARLTTAPGNGAAIGGLKVTTENAWFAARPSGTEDVYKVYAESFRGPDHLAQVQAEAREVVSAALGP